MIKRTILTTIFVCTTGLSMAAEVANNQSEPVTTLETIKVRAAAESYTATHSSSATRTDTPIREIPQSIQVVPRKVIEDQQNVTVSEALKNASSVVTNAEFSTPAFETTRIRGFAAEQLVDGFSQYYNAGDRESLINIEKLEVLKGANAILHSGGAGAPVGGMINIVSKLPEARAFGELGIKGGSRDFVQPFVDINQPFGDYARFRITGEYTNARSNVDVIHQKRYNINPAFTLTNNTNTTWTLQGKTSHWAQQEYQGLPATGTLTGNFKIKRDLFVGNKDIPDSIAEFNSVWTTLNHRLNDTWSFNAKARYAVSRFDEKTQLISSNSPDLSFISPSTWQLGNAQLAQKQREYSAMANATAKFDFSVTKNTVVLGGDYTEVKDIGFLNSDSLLAFNPIDLANPVFNSPYVVPPSSAFTSFNDSIVKNKTYGGFAQWQSTIYERFHFLAGFRVSHVGVHYQELTNGTNTKTDKLKVLPRVGGVVDISQYFSLFASYSKGMRGQSFSIFAPGVKPAPAESTSAEAGVKFDVNRALVGQMALFQIDRSNVAVGFPATPTGEQRSRGFDADATWQPTDAWSLLANYAYTDAKFTNRVNATTVAGSPVQGIPKHAVRVWANYSFQQDLLKGLSLGLGTNWQSGVFVEDSRTFKTDNHYSMDAAAAYKTEHFKLALTVKNLTAARYFQYYNYFGGRVRPDDGTNVYFTASFKY